MSRLYLLVLVSLVILNNPTYGQQGVLRKRVTRNLYLPCEKDKDGKRAVTKDWQSFFRQLNRDICAMKVAAYKRDDLAEAFDSLTLNMDNRIDTAIRTDPVTGEEKRYARDTTQHFENILAFRFLEEWTYHPETQKTTITITAAAPVKDVYGDDNTFRGTQAMCWIKWDAFEKFLYSLSGFDTAEKIGVYLMTDYMQDTAIVKGAVQTPTFNKQSNNWEGNTLRHIKLQPDNDYVLLGYNPSDTSVTELLYRAASVGNCKIFKREKDKQATILSNEDIAALKIYQTGTVTLEDPIDKRKITKVFKIDLCFDCVKGYNIEEKWTLDMQKGSTEISYTWVAPIKYLAKEGDETADGTEPLFWIKYEDAINILSKYKEYHPVQNLEYQLWDERFREPKHKPLCEQN